MCPSVASLTLLFIAVVLEIGWGLAPALVQ
jgi:hypothetical protein